MQEIPEEGDTYKLKADEGFDDSVCKVLWADKRHVFVQISGSEKRYTYSTKEFLDIFEKHFQTPKPGQIWKSLRESGLFLVQGTLEDNLDGVWIRYCSIYFSPNGTSICRPVEEFKQKFIFVRETE